MSTFTFSWDDREQFVSELLAAGGSGSITGETSDKNHLGRYGRQYSSAAADVSGRTATFHCETMGERPSYFVLTVVPWARSEDYEEVYALLIRAGATPNDLTASERERAVAARNNYRSMKQVAEIESREVADGARYVPPDDEQS